ncbi:Hemolysin-coregulated protein (uncharacterized) [Nocardioides sp. J9]|uniref:type VI secretion system tube protein Hcp n=1 Tax=unclassified Nocardioides TaxID=2615069 RepID=UPI00048C693D|nr:MULTISPECIES: type VI secretion system tube protein Hcp [unclassified Nocardioides]TWH02372.1 Hemolysin-coregulated protein (uncharacterized) [Nocardioides sp. J9]
MTTSRTRARLAAVLAVGAIGAVSIGLTSVGTADADKGGKPPKPEPGTSAVATMTIHPSSGDPIEVEVTSLQTGVGVSVSGSAASGQREASRPSLTEMNVTRSTDSTSPVLFGYITTGTLLPEVELAGTLPDGTPFEYELGDVFLSSQASAAGDENFTESLSLNFASIRTTVGGNSAAYDQGTGSVS